MGLVLQTMSASDGSIGNGSTTQIKAIGSLAITGAFDADGDEHNGLIISSSDGDPTAQTRAGTFYVRTVGGAVKPYFIGAGGSATDLSSTSSSAGGSTTQVQVNTDGSLAGITNMTSDGTNVTKLVVAATAADTTITSTNNSATAIKLHADAGAAQCITLLNDAGTAVSDTVAAIQATATLGAITLNSGLANAAAIRLKAADTAGGVDIDAGTGGVAIDTTGPLSIDSAGGASNISHTGTSEGDSLTISMDGSVDAALTLLSHGTGDDALQITASAGGIDITAVAGAAGEDIDIGATTSSVNINRW